MKTRTDLSELSETLLGQKRRAVLGSAEAAFYQGKRVFVTGGGGSVAGETVGYTLANIKIKEADSYGIQR